MIQFLSLFAIVHVPSPVTSQSAVRVAFSEMPSFPATEETSTASFVAATATSRTETLPAMTEMSSAMTNTSPTLTAQPQSGLGTHLPPPYSAEDPTKGIFSTIIDISSKFLFN